MTVRSRRVATLSVSGNGTYQTVYTVPGGRTLVVRQVAAANTTLSATGYLSIGGYGGGSITAPMLTKTAMASLELLQGNGWWAFNPGEVIYCYLGSGGPVNVTVWGSLLEGAPA